MQPVTIPCAKSFKTAARGEFETITIDADVYGIFAVHKTIGGRGKGWTVTHLLSGMSIWSYNQKQIATRLAKTCAKQAEQDTGWHFTLEEYINADDGGRTIRNRIRAAVGAYLV